MNYTTTKDPDFINGTSYLTEFKAPYKTLVALFGNPIVFSSGKSDVEWIVKLDPQTAISIYNWKDGKNYDHKNGLAAEDLTDWHVGSYPQKREHVDNFLRSLGL